MPFHSISPASFGSVCVAAQVLLRGQSLRGQSCPGVPALPLKVREDLARPSSPFSVYAELLSGRVGIGAGPGTKQRACWAPGT